MRHSTPVLVAAAAALAACGRPGQDPRTLPPLVSVVDVQSGEGGGQSFTGVVRARIESDLGFRVGGKIAERLVDPGQSVRRGQALLRLDPNDLALSADAQNAAVAAAKARSIQADADLKRLQGLVDHGAVSAQTWDEAKAGADSARAQLASAEAQARVAMNARGYAILAADADGVVEDLLAEPGQVVAAGQAVVRLAHAGPREAAANLPETVRPAIGSSATARLYGSAAAPMTARLRQISQAADPATRTYEARYVLQNADAAPLGATVTVTLPGAATAEGARVPLGAVYDPGPGPGVWRVDHDRIAFQAVKLLAMDAETATVAGISPGARIVALGADHLREGQHIRTALLPGLIAGQSPLK